eukprot:scaffold149_cov315-Pinguiococcus_pyrenoidosus.AAC.66
MFVNGKPHTKFESPLRTSKPMQRPQPFPAHPSPAWRGGGTPSRWMTIVHGRLALVTMSASVWTFWLSCTKMILVGAVRIFEERKRSDLWRPST